jgi:hypothetical protein
MIQNATDPYYSGGYSTRQINSTVNWFIPLLPGEPPNVQHLQLSVCVPSDHSILETCCTAVNGTFITENLLNRTVINQTSNTYAGSYEPTPNSTFRNSFNWCRTPWSPGSNGTSGYIPDSMVAWQRCFNATVGQEALQRLDTVYECRLADGGYQNYFESFPRFISTGKGEKTNTAWGLMVVTSLILGVISSC